MLGFFWKGRGGAVAAMREEGGGWSLESVFGYGWVPFLKGGGGGVPRLLEGGLFY